MSQLILSQDQGYVENGWSILNVLYDFEVIKKSISENQDSENKEMLNSIFTMITHFENV